MFVKGDVVRFIGRRDEGETVRPGAVARITRDLGEEVVHRFGLEGSCATFAASELELVQAVAQLHECTCGTCTCYPSAA